MTLSTTKTTGDTITAAEFNEGATASNKVTDSTLDAADVSSGTFATGRISEVSVTQHLGSYLQNVAEDTTPQLGGDLDLNSNDITGTGNVNITGSGTLTGDMDIVGALEITDTTNNSMALRSNNSSFTRFIIDNTGAGDAQFNFQFSGSTAWALGADDSDGDKFKISNGATLTTATALTIDTSEQVGIGTTTPSRTLHVESGGTNNCARFESTDATTTLEIIDNSTSNNGALTRTGDLLILCNGGGEVQVEDTISAVSEVDDGNSSTADTIDWTTGNFHKSTMTGNCTYTFTAPTGPSRLTLRLVQDATGSRVATWPAAVQWAGGTAPTLSTAASSEDLITLYYDGTNYHGSSLLDSQ